MYDHEVRALYVVGAYNVRINKLCSEDWHPSMAHTHTHERSIRLHCNQHKYCYVLCDL